MTPVLVIAGPTAVGKSSLAHAVAQEVGAEIISADSRQVYRGLSIGTAKPTKEERAQVPYHLLDVLDVGARFSAGEFLQCVQIAITDVHSRNRPVVVVGGSTLYVHALVEGLAEVPSVSPGLEAELLSEARTRSGAAGLFEELSEVDPQAAATVDATKTHRLVRWVGVWRETGRRPSSFWDESKLPPVPSILTVLTRPRDDLYRRIDARVLRMMDAGLLSEVAHLASLGPVSRSTLEATIGYRELLPVLAGERTVEAGVRLIQRNSRRYAKRQLTWYRRYSQALWLDASETTPERLLDAVAPWPYGVSAPPTAHPPEPESSSPPDDRRDRA